MNSLSQTLQSAKARRVESDLYTPKQLWGTKTMSRKPAVDNTPTHPFLLLCCFASTEARRLIRDGDRGVGVGTKE